MHKISVIALGSKNFNISLEELKDHLHFNLTTVNNTLENKELKNYDVILLYEDCLKNSSLKQIILKEINIVKILVTNSDSDKNGLFSEKLLLPTTLKTFNQIIQNSVVKKNYKINSSIKIKGYVLDKNEKKLSKDSKYILLTEKEIQLLELFLNCSKPVNKNKILEEVWMYAADADTHTVETHIYRLRKKIKSKFLDDSFILNNGNGYLL